MDSAAQFDRAGRDQAFGYECHRCLRCCRHKRIQLNPYEVARLARNRGLSTSEFRAAHTLEGQGMVLAQDQNGDCGFLGAEGCTVHPDRPLVCRLYPLGRFVSFDGVETFGRAKPHAESLGVYHDRSTVADFLAGQDVDPFTRAADDYMAWLTRALEILTAATGRSVDTLLDSAGDDGQLLDLDAAIAEHCRTSGAPEPADIEARRRLHLSILDQKLQTWEGNPDGL